ncbi:FAD/NAD(P)-binding protein [Bradyrhizobium canariense]|uniref:FAD/NAD(P)-binding protein n=1 Tax=Bradyrhizobium canariense TaxID=255045 RepID=UPI001B8A2AFE|nr:FAD/NAD(P)-binding protein [Bradyrhizobium canariense]MBR0955342.1 FAD-dependent oxidoreductase [Bradyrhizobium canariense]
MNAPAWQHAIIIGGGASGVLLAYQLLKDPASDLSVTLIERRPEIGRGVAYHTGNPEHLLNVRVGNMSALPDEPEHFWRWLCTRPDGPMCPDPYCFVPRQIYGDYLAGLIESLTSNGGAARLAVVQGECVSVQEGPAGVAATLDDGRRFTGDLAICATGHDAAAVNFHCQVDPWTSLSAVGVDRLATVLILGSGLTMADYVLSLLRNGHQGPIVALSRRGLLAKGHRRVDSLRIEEREIPFGASITVLLRWFRQRAEAHIAGGGDWRSVIDGLRPFTQRLWLQLPDASKRRFLEHARAWWDVHRHRMAPEVEHRLGEAIAARRVVVIPGKLSAVTPNEREALVRFRRRGCTELSELRVGAIVDCTGLVKDPATSSNPAVRSLLEQGLARVDPLHIGIEIGTDCAIVARNGSSSQRLFAIGPLTRAAFWEIIAIPDIRNQCAELAARLIERSGQTGQRRDAQASNLRDRAV